MASSPEDITKRYLEVFKQIAQIDTAAILVLLGIQGVVQINPWWVAPSIGSFVVSLLFGLLGLLLTAKQRSIQQNPTAETNASNIPYVWFDITLAVSMIAFVNAVFTAVVILMLIRTLTES